MTKATAVQEVLKPFFPGLMGVELIDVTPDRVVASMLVRPDLCPSGGILHGGAIVAFADTLGAVGAFVNLPERGRTTTIESKTNFLGAAPVGTRAIGESTPVHRGRTTMVWQTRIKSDGGELCVMVIQTQMILAS